MLTEKQRHEIRKTTTSRLQLKLSRAGYSDEEVESFDRQACIEKWAELVVQGIELKHPQANVSESPEVELERERLRWEQQKFADEMQL